MAGYQHDYDGFGAFLRSPEMIRAMESVAADMKSAAVAISPEQTGDYKSRFKVTSGTWPAGGGGPEVAVAHLENTSGHAAPVEYGNKIVKRHRVLGKVAAQFGGTKKGGA